MARIMKSLICIRVQDDDDEAKEQKRELALEVEQMTHFSGDFDDAAAPTERKGNGQEHMRGQINGFENELF